MEQQISIKLKLKHDIKIGTGIWHFHLSELKEGDWKGFTDFGKALLKRIIEITPNLTIFLTAKKELTVLNIFKDYNNLKKQLTLAVQATELEYL